MVAELLWAVAPPPPIIVARVRAPTLRTSQGHSPTVFASGMFVVCVLKGHGDTRSPKLVKTQPVSTLIRDPSRHLRHICFGP